MDTLLDRLLGFWDARSDLPRMFLRLTRRAMHQPDAAPTGAPLHAFEGHDLPALFRHLKASISAISDVRYASAVAFVRGLDAATGWALVGFGEWLVVMADDAPNLHRDGLALRIAFPGVPPEDRLSPPKPNVMRSTRSAIRSSSSGRCAPIRARGRASTSSTCAACASCPPVSYRESNRDLPARHVV